jgi:hypothetical protein
MKKKTDADEGAIVMQAPVKPTDAQVEAHRSSHTPYARWCIFCVQGRGREDRHHSMPRVIDNDEESTPVIQCDYCFPALVAGGESLTILTMIDEVYHWIHAVVVGSKGPDIYAVRAMARWVRGLGFPKVLIRSDSEPATIALVNKVCETVPFASPNFLQ